MAAIYPGVWATSPLTAETEGVPQYTVRVCMFIPHPRTHNIDLQSADSAALNLPSQLQAACGSAPTLASAECHRASHSPSLCRLSPANRRCVGGGAQTQRALTPTTPREKQA